MLSYSCKQERMWLIMVTPCIAIAKIDIPLLTAQLLFTIIVSLMIQSLVLVSMTIIESNYNLVFNKFNIYMTENEVTKLKRNIIIFNILLIIAIITGDICYIQSESLLIKAITSFGFLLQGSINLVYSIKIKSEHIRFPIMMVIGLFFAMLGDILLNIHFITGAIFFAVGHVFYFIAYTVLVKLKLTDFIPAGMIFVSSAMLTCAPIFNFKSDVMKAICITYALVISFMVGKAISNYIRHKNSVHKVILLGSILFFFSDLMLLFKVFSDAPAIISTLCLLSYYPAECLLAYCILHINMKKITISHKQDETVTRITCHER